MARFPPKPEYLALPWATIRELYETSDISMQALAMQYGISSKTILYRRAKAEGWQRRLHNIATHLALMDVAGFPPQGTAAEAADNEAEPVTAETLRDEAEAATILTARSLATMQAKRINEQLKIAGEIQAAGRAIIRRVVGVLEAPEAAVADNIKRLIAVSPDGERLAGLLKAAAEAIDRGVIMERRALGMDVIHGTVPNADAPPNPAYSSEAAINIVKKLDVTLGLKLRQFTAATLEARRDRRFSG